MPHSILSGRHVLQAHHSRLLPPCYTAGLVSTIKSTAGHGRYHEHGRLVPRIHRRPALRVEGDMRLPDGLGTGEGIERGQFCIFAVQPEVRAGRRCHAVQSGVVFEIDGVAERLQDGQVEGPHLSESAGPGGQRDVADRHFDGTVRGER